MAWASCRTNRLPLHNRFPLSLGEKSSAYGVPND
jgi:hypothetical protein